MARFATRRFETIAVLGALAFVAGGCSAAVDESDAQVRPAPASSATSTTASSAPVEETAPPSTEQEGGGAEDAVREIHTRFMTELFERDEAFAGVDVMVPLIEELTTGDERDRLLAGIAEREEEGTWIVSAGYGSSIVEVNLDLESEPAIAIVTDCSLDRAFVQDTDGKIQPPDDEWAIRETVLVETADSGWLVTSFTPEPGEPCDGDE